MFMGRTRYGLYQDAVALCKSEDEEKWRKAVYWVFDAPNINKPYQVCFFPHNCLKFSKERIEFLKELKVQKILPSFVNVVEPIQCQSKKIF
jgi:hypothetical protein